MTQNRKIRTAITAIRASAPLRQYVEAMLPARIMLWIMWSVENDRSGVATDDLRAACGRNREALALLISGAANTMVGQSRSDAALDVLRTAIDAQFGQYAEGPHIKTTAWMAIAAHHLAATLLDDGLIPEMQVGSIMAECMDRSLDFVTADDLDLYGRYARKAAEKALEAMRDPKTWGLYRAAFDPAAHRWAAVVAAVNAPGTEVVVAPVR